jgi:hypothetical protein
MSLSARLAAVLAAATLVLTAAGCGTDAPPGDAGAPATAATAPGGGPAAGAMLPADGAATDLAALLAGPVGVTRAVTAHVVVDAGGTARLCGALRESYPPQCGEPSVPVTGLPDALVDGLTAAGGVRWSDAPVQLVGAVRDGVFVNDPAALAAS